MTTDTEMTFAEAADMTRRYYELKRVESDLKRQLETMNKTLREFIEKRGEPVDVEGIPVLRLKPRSNGWVWDVKSLAEKEPVEFGRMLDMGALTVDKKVADALAAAGHIGFYRQYGVEGQTSQLAFDREQS